MYHVHALTQSGYYDTEYLSITFFWLTCSKTSQKFTGGPFGITSKIPEKSLTVVQGKELITVHEADNGSGTTLHREFCKECGSPILERGVCLILFHLPLFHLFTPYTSCTSSRSSHGQRLTLFTLFVTIRPTQEILLISFMAHLTNQLIYHQRGNSFVVNGIIGCPKFLVSLENSFIIFKNSQGCG